MSDPQNKFVKLIVYVPPNSGGKIRQLLASEAAGQLGGYDSWSVTTSLTERFRPLEGANPSNGKINQIEAVISERIETLCLESGWQELVDKIKKEHPYEEPAIEVIPLLYPTK